MPADCTKLEISSTVLIIISILYGTVGLAAVILNAVILLAMIKDPLKRLRTTFNYLVVNLSVCDFLDGAVALPLLVYFNYYSDHYRKLNQMVTTSLGVFLPNTIQLAVGFSMCALSIDRYKAIVYPIKYRQNVSWTRCVKYTLSIWVLAIVGTLPLALLSKNELADTIYMNVCPVFIGAVMSIVFLRVKNVLRSNHTEFEDKMKESLTASQDHIANRLKTEQKITRVYTIILVTVLATSLPGLILLDVSTFLYGNDCFFVFVVSCVRLLLLAINSVTNAWICMFLLKDFRESIRVMLCGGDAVSI